MDITKTATASLSNNIQSRHSGLRRLVSRSAGSRHIGPCRAGSSVSAPARSGSPRFWLTALAVTVAILLVGAACSGGSDESSTTTTTVSESTTTTVAEEQEADENGIFRPVDPTGEPCELIRPEDLTELLNNRFALVFDTPGLPKDNDPFSCSWFGENDRVGDVEVIITFMGLSEAVLNGSELIDPTLGDEFAEVGELFRDNQYPFGNPVWILSGGNLGPAVSFRKGNYIARVNVFLFDNEVITTEGERNIELLISQTLGFKLPAAPSEAEAEAETTEGGTEGGGEGSAENTAEGAGPADAGGQNATPAVADQQPDELAGP